MRSGCLPFRELRKRCHCGIKDGIENLKINRALSYERNDVLIEAPTEPCRRSPGAFGDASQRVVEICAGLKFDDIVRPPTDCLAAFVGRRHRMNDEWKRRPLGESQLAMQYLPSEPEMRRPSTVGFDFRSSTIEFSLRRARQRVHVFAWMSFDQLGADSGSNLLATDNR